MRREQMMASRSLQAVKAFPGTLAKGKREATASNVKICEVYAPLESELTTEASVPVTTTNSPIEVHRIEANDMIATGNAKRTLKIRRLETDKGRSVCDKETMTERQKSNVSNQLTILLKEVKSYKLHHSKRLQHLSSALQTCEGEVRTLASSVTHMLDSPSCESLRTSVELLSSKVSRLQSAQVKNVAVMSQLRTELATCKGMLRERNLPASMQTTPKSSHSSTPLQAHTPQPSTSYSQAMQTLHDVSRRVEHTLAFSTATRRRLGAI